MSGNVSLSDQDYHEALSKIVLNDTVPARSRELFETAKNLSLYSWFVYRFHPIAELTGWLALENALLEKAKREGELARDTERARLCGACWRWPVSIPGFRRIV